MSQWCNLKQLPVSIVAFTNKRNALAVNALIIGSGIGGLATAIRLCVKGYQVVVCEANSYVGGKLTVVETQGYRFDAGPSLFTMPQLVDELFELAGKQPGEALSYEKQEEACRYFWEDGMRLTAWSEANRFAEEAATQLDVSPHPLRNHLQRSRMLYDSTARIFMEQSLHKARTWFTRDVAKALTKLPQLGLFETMHANNERHLNHPKLVQLFDRFATYNGSDPYQAPGIMNVIPHLEHGIGTYFPKGGMHSITKSLHALAQELGVEFKLNCPVEEILVQNGRAVGIQANQERLWADVVVSNMDIVPTYRKLLKGQPAPEKTLKQERSSSALIHYWGIRRTFPELGLHNILFSNNYREEFRQLFDNAVPSADPTVYLHISSKAEESDAPPGCENWFVMVNAPRNAGQYTPEAIATVRKQVLNKIHRALGVDIAPYIVTEDVLHPGQIESRTSSHMGALYGAASNNKFAAFLRHPNFSSKLQNLYFVGGSVHPGGGIPLCLLSAKITASLIPDAH